MKINPFENFKNHGTLSTLPEEYEHPSESDNKDVLEEKKEKPKFPLFYIFSILALAVFSYKLINIQVVEGAKYQYMAEGNRIRTRDILPPRGIIYDNKGETISQNVASFNLDLIPAELPQDKEERNKIYQLIEENFEINIDEISSKVEASGLFSVDPIVIKEDIDRDEALALKIKYSDISGIFISAQPNRHYENIGGLGHIVGYIGKISPEELEKDPNYKIISVVGKSGLEITYENVLQGEMGKEQIEVDSRGSIQRTLASIDPKPGNNIYLGINLEFQKEIDRSLNEMIKQREVKSAVAVVMDVKSGLIRGMVSVPSYDNNIFTQNFSSEEYKKLIEDDKRPMVNRAISGIYPSGSTIKPVIAAAGLAEGVISENTTISDPGEIKIGEWVFPDWKNHGLVNVRKAIAESCNVFFYAVGGGWDKIPGLGAERIKKYLELFGFGEKTNIDLPGEEIGLIPDPKWKKEIKNESWYLGDTYHMSIGQGDFLTTPLQMVVSTSAIANGGKLIKPHMVEKETDFKGDLVKEYNAEITRENFIDSYVLQVVREGMRQTVESGSGKFLNDLPVSSAGKTGTAQFDQTDRTHAWYIGFAPYEDPEIAIVVLIEAGGEGHDSAVPVAKEILNWYFTHK